MTPARGRQQALRVQPKQFPATFPLLERLQYVVRVVFAANHTAILPVPRVAGSRGGHFWANRNKVARWAETRLIRSSFT